MYRALSLPLSPKGIEGVWWDSAHYKCIYYYLNENDFVFH